MGALILLGLGIVGFLLVLLFLKLGEIKSNGSNHFLLQLLILGFILGIFILIGKATLDIEQTGDCNWNKVNSTVNGNLTTYDYDYQCNIPTTSTALIFYKVILWLVRVVAIYIFLYFAYEVARGFGMFSK